MTKKLSGIDRIFSLGQVRPWFAMALAWDADRKELA